MLLTKIKPTHIETIRMGFRISEQSLDYKILIQIEPKVLTNMFPPASMGKQGRYIERMLNLAGVGGEPKICC